MSRITIDLQSASEEQFAAQIVTLLRENVKDNPAVRYEPCSLECILKCEFSPVALGRNVQGGILIEYGGYSHYGGEESPDWLRNRYYQGVNWLRHKGFLVRKHDQVSDDFVELTAEGKLTEISPTEMQFVIARNWKHWRSQYESNVFHLEIRKGDDINSGTAFIIDNNRFVTCKHNLVGDVFVCIDGSKVPIIDVVEHTFADVAKFSLGSPLPGKRLSLPIQNSLPLPGEEIAILGFPTVAQRLPALTITNGMVESLPNSYIDNLQYIQVSAQAAGGNSGSAVIDNCGRVIGVFIESTFEAVHDSQVPSRQFPQVVPSSYFHQII